MVQHGEVVIAAGEGAALQADDATQRPRMLRRQVQHDPPADGAAHDDGAVEAKGLGHPHHQPGIAGGGQAILLGLPAGGRAGFAVARHVEGDAAEAAGDVGVVQQVPPLAAVAAGGVQQQQRHALAGFLDIDPVRPALDVHAQVTAGDRLDRDAAAGVGAWGRGRGGPFAQQRQRALEPQQMGEEPGGVALDPQRALAAERQQVVPAGQGRGGAGICRRPQPRSAAPG